MPATATEDTTRGWRRTLANFRGKDWGRESGVFIKLPGRGTAAPDVSLTVAFGSIVLDGAIAPDVPASNFCKGTLGTPNLGEGDHKGSPLRFKQGGRATTRVRPYGLNREILPDSSIPFPAPMEWKTDMSWKSLMHLASLSTLSWSPNPPSLPSTQPISSQFAPWPQPRRGQSLVSKSSGFLGKTFVAARVTLD